MFHWCIRVSQVGAAILKAIHHNICLICANCSLEMEDGDPEVLSILEFLLRKWHSTHDTIRSWYGLHG